MRQLAAILFADMTGYTALMQENEHLARLKRRRLKEVLEVTISQFFRNAIAEIFIFRIGAHIYKW